MTGNETNKLVRGALLLTLAGLIGKLLSAGYRIPLQNLTGDLGFYIYQQVYPLLGMALVLSLYGFPSAISRMTAELRAEGKSLSLGSFYMPVFLILLLINGGIFLFIYFNAHQIAGWVGDTHLTETYKYAAFAFLLVPFTALIRGVLQGMQEMKPTAYSQIGEQFIRVFVIIFAAVFVSLQAGDIYLIGKAAAIAAIGGSTGALLIVGIFFWRTKPIVYDRYAIPWHFFIKTILVLGVAAALNHMVLLVIQFADTFTLVPSLMEYGYSQLEAMKLKGVFDRGQPLIQLGTVLGSSFALAMIPSTTKEWFVKDPKAFYTYIHGALVISFYLATGAMVGLIVIFPEVNTLLYQNDQGTLSLRILVIAIFLSSIAITAGSILQGMGYIKRTAGFILIALFAKWTLNQVLVPFAGIIGSALGTVISLALLALLMLYALKRILPGLQVEKHISWPALFIAVGGMTGFLLLVDYLVGDPGSRLVLLVYVLLVVTGGAMIYLFLLLRFGAFTEEQLSMMPFAPLLIRFHQGRKHN